jgi:hypothetical protein
MKKYSPNIGGYRRSGWCIITTLINLPITTHRCTSRLPMNTDKGDREELPKIHSSIRSADLSADSSEIALNLIVQEQPEREIVGSYTIDERGRYAVVENR